MKNLLIQNQYNNEFLKFFYTKKPRATCWLLKTISAWARIPNSANSVILCIPNSVNPIFGKKLIYTLLLFKMWEEKASELINKVK